MMAMTTSNSTSVKPDLRGDMAAKGNKGQETKRQHALTTHHSPLTSSS
jgi:hypothetical protein